MIEEVGVITAVDDDHIWVETKIKTTCGSCQAQDNCGTGVVAKTFAPKTEQLILRCHEPAVVGQQVKLGIDENQLLGATAMMYLLPLVVLIVASLLAQWALPLLGLNHELWIVASGFFASYLSFVWIRRKANDDPEHSLSPKLLAVLPVKSDLIEVKQVN